MHCGMFSGSLGFYPLDASSYPLDGSSNSSLSVVTKPLFQTMSNVFWGQNHTWLKNSLKLRIEQLLTFQIHHRFIHLLSIHCVTNMVQCFLEYQRQITAFVERGFLYHLCNLSANLKLSQN